MGAVRRCRMQCLVARHTTVAPPAPVSTLVGAKTPQASSVGPHSKCSKCSKVGTHLTPSRPSSQATDATGRTPLSLALRSGADGRTVVQLCQATQVPGLLALALGAARVNVLDREAST